VKDKAEVHRAINEKGERRKMSLGDRARFKPYFGNNRCDRLCMPLFIFLEALDEDIYVKSTNCFFFLENALNSFLTVSYISDFYSRGNDMHCSGSDAIV
jgi:hypothetical protein